MEQPRPIDLLLLLSGPDHLYRRENSTSDQDELGGNFEKWGVVELNLRKDTTMEIVKPFQELNNFLSCGRDISLGKEAKTDTMRDERERETRICGDFLGES